MALTVTLDLPPHDREVLESWLRAPSMSAGLVRRARIVLLAADGVAVKDIVERVGVSKPRVISWEEAVCGRGHRWVGGSAEAGRRNLSRSLRQVGR
ncbi:MAG TPA: helix-turn-helix domain-containing protein [Pseudonocardiaceae bacterium]|nr:helix-turn-helix domain-containing protein [Pseudonocardiaceae bacterium]